MTMKLNNNRDEKNGVLRKFESICYKYRYVLGLLFLIFTVSVPFLGFSRVQMRLMTMICLYAILGMGLNVLIGYTGLVSLGHAGFYGIGAYVCALLQVKMGWSFWTALLAAGAFTAVIGLLLGLPSLRLTGTYLSIVTLGFCEIVQMVLKQWESVTNGNYGIRDIPRPTIFGIELNLTNGGFLVIGLLLAAVTAIACMLIKKSNTGRAFTAIRDDELAASMMGIRTSRYKVISFVISAFITGIAGGFYSVINGYIEPTNFVFNISIMILSVVIIGGVGTIRGMIFGAALIQLFPEVFRGLNEWRFVVFGLLLVLVMRFRPQGVLGWESTQPYHFSKRCMAMLAEDEAAEKKG